jgi:endo-1,3-1,4-beta-glycanase ExoK
MTVRRAARAAAIVLVVCATVTQAPADAGRAFAAGRTLVAAEEFDDPALDTARWGAYNSKSSNGVSTYSPDQLRVTGGELQIIGEGKDPTGAANVSGALCWCGANGNHTYGLFAIKAKLDPGKGYGPAILLWPESNIWPQHGEIDIIESVQPNRVTDLASLHWGDPPRGKRDSGKIRGDFTDWRIYWVDWQPEYVKIYVDNYLIYDSTTSQQNPTIPSNPMHVTLQQEPGPYGPDIWLPAPDETTPDQVIMHVDWVRIYR